MVARVSSHSGHGWQGIIAHPLFSTLVPLWLAATFALSTLAISGAVLERVVLATQLDLILPMATPPLGMTARLMLAAGFGLVGALLGWLAVKWLVPVQAAVERETVQAYRARMSQPVAPASPAARAPLRAHAELGPQGFDNPYMTPEYAAPPVAPLVAPVAQPLPAARPAPVEPAVQAAPPPVPAHDSLPPVPSVAPPAPVVADAAAPAVRSAGFPLPPVDGPSAAQAIAQGSLDSLGHVELIERLAIAMQRRRSAAAQPAEPAATPSEDGTSLALRNALANLREAK